jgi:CRP/FNR family cyclic AMP-dependent transcriptional regulator
MPKGTRLGPSLLSGLPGRLATDLFAGAKPVRLAADEVLFLAGDPGDGCYRIEDGLAQSGNGVRAPAPSGSSRFWARAPSSASFR